MRQIHLHCGVSLCDVNLGESEMIYWLEWKDVSRSVFKDRLLNLRKIAVLLHKVAAGKLRVKLPASFLYNFLCETTLLPFRVAFRSAFLRSGFHSCP